MRGRSRRRGPAQRVARPATLGYKLTPCAAARWSSSLAIAIVAASLVAAPHPAGAFGDVGAFDPRVLLTGSQTRSAHASAPGRWAWELVQRTSAPARLHPSVVRADDPAIVDAPFLYWSGDSEVAPLTGAEVAGLRRFFALGGVLLVDDAAPGDAGTPSAFGQSARRENRESAAGQYDHRDRCRPCRVSNVLFSSATRRARGGAVDTRRDRARWPGSGALQRERLGRCARTRRIGHVGANGRSGRRLQREHAIRLAVNIAMYVLCSNYKDDQVHAPYLMRRRALSTP